MNNAARRPRRDVRLPHDGPPRLLVVIHTEEEFDWSAPFDSSQTGLSHIQHLKIAQALFARFAVKPIYVVDFSVASQDVGIRAVKDAMRDGNASIGAHLHPWVNPPIVEEISTFHSYPGNLPRDLEHEKLLRLTEQIADAFATRPDVYLAGRYGFGDHTLDILQALRYRIDLSGVAMTDFGEDGGPDYGAWDNSCFWQGDPAILRIPHSVCDAGFLCAGGRRMFAPEKSMALRRLRMPGLLSRCGAMTRLRLSPEGFALPHLKRCARTLVAVGARVLVFSFHSPSLAPGFTPYVRDRADQAEFVQRIEGFLHFFRDEMGGIFVSPHDVLAAAQGAS